MRRLLAAALAAWLLAAPCFAEGEGARLKDALPEDASRMLEPV